MFPHGSVATNNGCLGLFVFWFPHQYFIILLSHCFVFFHAVESGANGAALSCNVRNHGQAGPLPKWLTDLFLYISTYTIPLWFYLATRFFLMWIPPVSHSAKCMVSVFLPFSLVPYSVVNHPRIVFFWRVPVVTRCLICRFDFMLLQHRNLARK